VGEGVVVTVTEVDALPDSVIDGVVVAVVLTVEVSDGAPGGTTVDVTAADPVASAERLAVILGGA
jgi:hypothetical protein